VAVIGAVMVAVIGAVMVAVIGAVMVACFSAQFETCDATVMAGFFDFASIVHPIVPCRALGRIEMCIRYR